MSQSMVALSMTEVEYIVVTEAIKEAMWLQGILGELGVHQQKVIVFCDMNFSMKDLNTLM